VLGTLEARRPSRRDVFATSTLPSLERIRTTLNAYDYAGDDPIDSVDPSGMCWSGFCWAAHAAHAVYHNVIKPVVCAVKKHPLEVAGAVVFGVAAVASLGVAGAGLAGFISADSALAGLGAGGGGLHAAGTLIVGGSIFAGASAGSAYGASREC
jgi:hypothetical protein